MRRCDRSWNAIIAKGDDWVLARTRDDNRVAFLCLGLTASFDPWGHSARSPTNDNGAISPTAALSAMPYVPAESLATLKHLYHAYGRDLWGPFGFVDAFNPTEKWFTPSYVAIDQGPILIVIENRRTQLWWNLFMSNPEIQPALNAIGRTSP